MISVNMAPAFVLISHVQQSHAYVHKCAAIAQSGRFVPGEEEDSVRLADAGVRDWSQPGDEMHVCAELWGKK